MEEKQQQQDIPFKNGHPDVEALMLRIRARVKADLGSRSSQLPRYVPPHTRLFEGDATQLLHSDELNYLNAQWNSWSTPEPFTSHRRFLGPLIVGAKNAIRRFLADSLFKTYFERERQFQMQLVRHLNATSRYIDIRDGALFWQLVQKMDSDIAAINERGDRLYSEAHGAHGVLEAKLENRLDTLELELSSVVQAIAQVGQGMQLLKANGALGSQLMGSQTLSSQSLAGAAAGAASDAPSVRIPPDLLDLTTGIETIEAYSDKSLSGVFLGGLPFSSPAERIPMVLARLTPKLAHNAHLVIEAVNPLTLAGRLYLSSRGLPLEAAFTSEVLQNMLETAGFLVESVDVGQITGYETLSRVESSDIFPARWRGTIESINRNSRRINDILFGGQMVRIHAVHADEDSGSPTLKMQVKSAQ